MGYNTLQMKMLNKIPTRYLIACVFLFIITTGVSFFIFSNKKISLEIATSTNEEKHSKNTTLYPDPPTEPIKLSHINVALLGHGDAGHQGGQLTDAILIAHFDTENKNFALISIPRDLWVSFPSGDKTKINHAYSQDRIEASVIKATLETVTGLPIHYFVAVDFFGITAIVDELEGVEVNLEATFEDPWYPIRGKELDLCGMGPETIEQIHNEFSGFQLERQFECRYEQLFLEEGTHIVDGSMALKLARSRHGSSDFERANRQQAILQGIKKKLISLDGLNKSGAVFEQLQHTFSSDLDIKLVRSIATKIKDLPEYRTSKVTLSTQNVLSETTSSNGQYILTPKSGEDSWASVHAFIAEQISSSK